MTQRDITYRKRNSPFCIIVRALLHLTARVDTLTEESAIANPRGESNGTKVQCGTLGGSVGTRLEDFIIFEGRSALSC